MLVWGVVEKREGESLGLGAGVMRFLLESCSDCWRGAKVLRQGREMWFTSAY